MLEKRDFKFFLFCFFILIASTLLLTGCVSKEDDEKIEEVAEGEAQEEITTSDFSEFILDNQEIGELGEETYEIISFSEESMSGYHSFVFELEGSDVLPYVTAEYRPDFGAIRLVFQGIQEDGSGIRYQRSYDLNEQGIIRIYHNISSEENEGIYDIGVSKEAGFFLHAEELAEGSWKINLDVRYPGEVDLNIDMGSEDFTTDEQRIRGATSSDGAGITTYSYTVDSSVFKFIWTVRGNQEKPIPEVRASYNEDGELEVFFPDLESDNIGRNSNEASLIGDVEKVIWSRTGGGSTYRFVLSSEKAYKLSSFLGPNQVILEIEL